MREIRSLLFICLGNTARSPVAEYLAKYYAKKYEILLRIESAGFINAFENMQPESHEYLKLKNIPHDDFSPQIINASLCREFDLILTMEQNHRDEITTTYNSIESIRTKTFTLKQFNNFKDNLDIVDPYYSSYEKYK
ncbi:MAG: hypothetical protein EU533_05810, partial [Promethearchaeota archaeon]